MTLDADVVAAVGELMVEGELAHRAVLIGGQAIRDWHLQQRHYLSGVAEFPAPRVSMDIDLVLLVEDETRLLAALERFWSAGARPHEYRWRRKPEVTLDLVGIRTNQTTTMGEVHVGRVGGIPRVTPAAVLRPWILSAPLVEDCFDHQLRSICLRRLNHLGLLASKLSAISNRLRAMRTTEERRAAGKPTGTPAEPERLPKDVTDAVLLLDRTWRGRISFLPGQLATELIPHLRKLLDDLGEQLRSPPVDAVTITKEIGEMHLIVHAMLPAG